MPFTPILTALCHRHEVIRGAIFCDEEGERVERVCPDSSLDEFDLDIAGASFASLLPYLTGQDAESSIRVAFEDDAYWVQLLVDGYFLLVIAQRGDGRDYALRQDLHDVGASIIAHM